MKHSLKILLLWLPVTLLLAGCIRDDRGECRFPLRLHFTYLRNLEQTDLLRPEVETLRLYLYDSESGKLVDSRAMEISDLDGDNTMVWNVAPGRYTLVTWGGVHDRYVINPASTLDAMTLTLPLDNEGHAPQRREHLWHSLDQGITVTGDLTGTHDIDLHKLSNDVKVTVTASAGHTLPEHAVSAITAANGVLNAYGREVDGAAPVTYIPSVEAGSRAPEVSVHSYTTLELWDGDESTLSVSLAGAKVYEGSLTSLIANDPKVDFDLYDEFTIAFVVTPHDGGDAAVSVSVNGWKVVEYDVTLK